MREILFRGKRISDGEWVYGCYTRYSEVMGYITVDITKGLVFEVDPETVSQHTETTDKNRVKIFEGDEFLCKSGTCKLSNKDDYDFIGEDKKYYKTNPPQKGVVVFDKCSFRGCFDGLMGNSLNCYDDIEVIGNIHEEKG